MLQKNWTLIIGCSAFIAIGTIALLTGSSLATAAFRASVASFLGGIVGFTLDYTAAHAPQLTLRTRPKAASQPAPDAAADQVEES